MFENLKNGGFIIKKIISSVLACLLVYSTYGSVSLQNTASAAIPACSNTFASKDGELSTWVQTTKYAGSSDRSVAFGVTIKDAHRSKYGSEVRAMMHSTRVNYAGVNEPYVTHYKSPDYLFHGSMKNYQYKGKSGGGTLKSGDRFYMTFAIVSMDTDAGDVVNVTCEVE